MSALNLIVLHDAAYLITDRAGVSSAGVIDSFESKIYCRSELSMAIAITGLAWPGQPAAIASWLSEQIDQDRAMRGLPTLLRALVADKDIALALPGAAELVSGMLDVITLAVAIWSHDRDQAEGYVITTGPGHLPDDVQPFRLRPAPWYVQPEVDRKFYPREGWDPHRDGLALLESQRLVPADWGALNIGGGVDLAKVDRAGASIQRLHDWPDTIGLKIGEQPPPPPRRRILGLFGRP